MERECIVIGVGGVGSAALYHLARRGVDVLGLERFAPGHDRGSSHGETRAIRLAYFEHPCYVPLLQRSYDLWDALEADTGERLFHRTGVLQVGPPDGEVITGIQATAAAHGLDVTAMDAAQVKDRFPGFEIPDGMTALHEANAGYLAVEACVRAHARRAVAAGATLHTASPATGWRAVDGGFVVTTETDTLRCRRLVITAGAWVHDHLAHLGVDLQVIRKTLHWYGAQDGAYAEGAGSPVFLYELPEGVIYGFPHIAPDGVKVARHTGGHPVTDPLRLDRAIHPEDHGPVDAFLRRWMPRVDPGDRRRGAVCMYTMTPDAHFVVDTDTRHPGLSFVTGLSGHGFKFTPVLGEIMADLAMTGQTDHPIVAFSHRRPALQRPQR
jgi:sarcosine oxidase